MAIVGVVIPAHNAGAFVGRAIESILGQSFNDLRVVVVDDGSRDNTAEAAEEYRDDRRYSLLRLDRNLGTAGARAAGCRLVADCKYIAAQDADDYSLPGRIEQQVARLEADTRLLAVGAAALLVSEDGSETRQGWPVPLSPARAEWASLWDCPMIGATMVVRTESYLAAGGYSAMPDDHDLLWRLLRLGDISSLDEALYCYRQYDADKITTSTSAGATALMAFFHAQREELLGAVRGGLGQWGTKASSGLELAELLDALIRRRHRSRRSAFALACAAGRDVDRRQLRDLVLGMGHRGAPRGALARLTAGTLVSAMLR